MVASGMKQCVIGVDGGGTNTSAIVLNQRGDVLGRGSSGPSNLYCVSTERVRQALIEAMSQAVATASVDLDQIGAITWALAGLGRSEDRDLLAEATRDVLPGIPRRLESDALAALVGGAGNTFGVVLIAGTGMISYGVNWRGEHARAGGWGHSLDQGSGYELAQEGLRAVVRAYDSCGLRTILTHALPSALGLKSSVDLFSWINAPERQLAEIAALAPVVLAAAEDGDPVALDIVARAADHLSAAVESVVQRLNLIGLRFPMVITGGLPGGSAFFRQVVSQAIQTRLPAVQPQAPQADAAVGAAMLALELIGQPIHSPPRPEHASTVTAETLATEKASVLSRDLDRRSVWEMVGIMHVEDNRALRSVRAVLPEISQAVEAIVPRVRAGGRLIYVGAGTSGRLGVLDASECPPTFNTDASQVMAIIAGGRSAILEAKEGVEDDTEVGCQDIAALNVTDTDCVVGITASGRTPYTLAALREARERRALAVAVVCNQLTPLVEIADIVICPLVGPEVIAGSTRLKAATAQKTVLNMLSTLTMVLLGKTYGNLMVDLRQDNEKLRARARSIVAQACSVEEEEAAKMLAQSGGDVKVAIVSILRGCPPEEARDYIDTANGVVREALSAKRARSF
jgi:N-acetylmuramic acid 6-phosphate etherase